MTPRRTKKRGSWSSRSTGGRVDRQRHLHVMGGKRRRLELLVQTGHEDVDGQPGRRQGCRLLQELAEPVEGILEPLLPESGERTVHVHINVGRVRLEARGEEVLGLAELIF